MKHDCSAVPTVFSASLSQVAASTPCSTQQGKWLTVLCVFIKLTLIDCAALAFTTSSCVDAVQTTPQETLYKIKTQAVPYPAELSDGALDFIRRALVRSPEQRASLPDLLQHPWIVRHMRPVAAPHMRGRTQTQVCLGSVCEEARSRSCSVLDISRLHWCNVQEAATPDSVLLNVCC